MTLEVYAAYLIAWTLIAIVPGPTVALIVSNNLTHGMRAGLLNVAGTLLARRHVRRLSAASGVCLIGGGPWLAHARAR